ncbi:hypothetical protein Cflav_PD1961 [Pedosphaera parvula Ellin514]|uniref:Uncharacterized protein n=1 Tax=Pedosphaera parvula (strain Ellin514) TaxID=320771 RepID=B9XMZ2_PEDPL|nr:hypothetical protein Cflav_PD1961 [Pedosphaera parvula Ellin514]
MLSSIFPKSQATCLPAYSYQASEDYQVGMPTDITRDCFTTRASTGKQPVHEAFGLHVQAIANNKPYVSK